MKTQMKALGIEFGKNMVLSFGSTMAMLIAPVVFTAIGDRIKNHKDAKKAIAEENIEAVSNEEN